MNKTTAPSSVGRTPHRAAAAPPYQDLYTGVDYSMNAERRLYFNLLYPVIAYAGEQGMRTLSLGQTSYTFKARLGAKPHSLFIYVKHRNRFIHSLLCTFRSLLFPPFETTEFHVFRDTAPSGETSAE